MSDVVQIIRIQEEIGGLDRINEGLDQSVQRLSDLEKQQKKTFSNARKEVERLDAANRKNLQTQSNVTRQLRLSSTQTEKAAKSTSLLRKGVGLLAGAFGGIVGLGLITFFSKIAENLGFVDKATAAVTAGIDVLTNRFSRFLSGDFTGAFQGLGSELLEASTAAIELTDRLKELERLEARFSSTIAESNTLRTRQRRIFEDENRSIRDRIAARQEEGQLEVELVSRQLGLAARRLAIAREQNDLRSPEKIKALADAEAQFSELQLIRDEARLSTQQEISELQREAAEQAAEARRKQQDQLNRLAELLQGKVVQAQDAAADSTEKLRLRYERANAELESLREQFIQAFGGDLPSNIASNFGIVFDQIQAEYETGLEELRQREREENDAAYQEFLDRQKQQAVATLEARIEAIETEAAIRTRQVENIQDLGNREVDLEKFKQKRLLEIQLEAIQARRQALLDANNGEINAETALLRLDAENIQEQINAIGSVDLSPLARIKQGILEAFQINEEELGILANSASNVAGSITDSLATIYQAELQQIDAVISRTDERIEELERALERELSLKEQGYANDVALLEQQLQEENVRREAAAKERAEIAKRQANIQIAIETAQQVSALGLAVARLLASEASKGVIGLAIGAAAVGTIFSVIAKAKAQAASLAVEGIPEFREGGQLRYGLAEGPSHQNGGLNLRDRSGRWYNIEGDEYVMPTKQTKKFFPLLEAMREEDFDPIGTRISTNELFKEGRAAAKIKAFNEQEKERETARMERLLEQIRDKTQVVITPEGDLVEATYTPSGSKKRIVKKWTKNH